MPHRLPSPAHDAASSRTAPERSGVARMFVRAMLTVFSLMLTVVVGVLLLSVALALSAGLGLRRLIARLRGQPVEPWAMPRWWHAARNAQAMWPQRARTHTVRTDDGQEVEIVEPASANNSSASKAAKNPFDRSPFGAERAADITDVQAHKPPPQD